MVNNNQSVSIKLQPESIRDIEIFVDAICDQLFINDTYYGNILMSLTEIFNYLITNSSNEKLNISYNSDYKNIAISFYPVDSQVVNSISNPVNIDDIINQDSDKNIFLIHSLVDNISNSSEKKLTLEFDISALHNEIYKKRASILKKYFSKQTTEKVYKEND